MPKMIKTAIKKMIRKFIWNNVKSSPISLKHLQKRRKKEVSGS